MRILASQTAVALQNSALFTKSVTLLAQSEARNAELLATQRELGAARAELVRAAQRPALAVRVHREEDGVRDDAARRVPRAHVRARR